MGQIKDIRVGDMVYLPDSWKQVKHISPLGGDEYILTVTNWYEQEETWKLPGDYNITIGDDNVRPRQ